MGACVIDGYELGSPKVKRLPILFFSTLIGLITVFPVNAEPVSVASIDSSDLVEFDSQPQAVKELIEYSLKLTDKKLSYTFGSNSPARGGMDCSGTIQHLLQSMGAEGVPRTSYAMYHWALEKGDLVKTPGVTETSDPVFSKLQPGHLLFWTGTYSTKDRNPPISHVMIYLGTLKADGKGVVFGASSGRRYRGKKIHGVSVFDWKVPSKSSTSKFVAYAPIPGLIREEVAIVPEIRAVPTQPKGLKSALEKLFGKSDASP